VKLGGGGGRAGRSARCVWRSSFRSLRARFLLRLRLSACFRFRLWLEEALLLLRWLLLLLSLLSDSDSSSASCFFCLFFFG